MIKWLIGLSLAAGLIAGLIGSTLGEAPDRLEVIRQQSEWQSRATTALVTGQKEPEKPAPIADTRPWIAKHPVPFGMMVAGGVFIAGLLIIIAMSSQPARAETVDAGDYNPDADLFEEFDDPYDETDPSAAPPSSVRANPRRKKARA